MDKFDEIYEKIKAKYETEIEAIRNESQKERKKITLIVLGIITLVYITNFILIHNILLSAIYTALIVVIGFCIVQFILSSKDFEKSEFYKMILSNEENLKKVLKVIVISISVLFLFTLSMVRNLELLIIPGATIFIIIGLMFVFVYMMKKASPYANNLADKQAKYGRYYQKFKELIITEILKNFDSNIYYEPKSGIKEEHYESAKFEYFTTYSSENYIKGTINNNNEFEMAEVHASNVISSREEITDIKIFNGLFMIINLSKNLNMKMKILNDKEGINENRHRLKMDSSEFEKYYDVFTTNAILAMRILTSNIMEELIQFIKETNIKYEISIRDDKLYIRFHTGNMFEPASISKYSLDKETLYRYYKILEFAFNVSEEIVKIIDDIEI